MALLLSKLSSSWNATSVERLWFGTLIIGGYFGVGYLGAVFFQHNTEGLALTHDAQMATGPLLGLIVASIWKTNQNDRIQADAAATMAAKAPDLSATTLTPAQPQGTN